AVPGTNLAHVRPDHDHFARPLIAKLGRLGASREPVLVHTRDLATIDAGRMDADHDLSIACLRLGNVLHFDVAAIRPGYAHCCSHGSPPRCEWAAFRADRPAVLRSRRSTRPPGTPYS